MVGSMPAENRLGKETSPYLLQHKENAVDWYPWGEEAWARARGEDKPVLVSIGYSACHWCHVMAHESFEDPETARLMNEHLVCIKVDREERPDVDGIYMEAVQAMTGQGGWPLNAFCSPEQVPFWAGTYFPPASRHGLPSWSQVVQAIADSWRERKDEIRSGAERIVEHLQGSARLRPAEGPVPDDLPAQAEDKLRELYDLRNGGFGGAPKFPPHSALEFLLEQGETEMSLVTLRAMARVGIHDQVAGGFARYAVDAHWTVPHFEKMLYDNALLARAFLHGWLVSGEDRLREVAVNTLDWALREMRGPEGGFASALDADADGVEGSFSVWTVAELHEVLGEDAEAAIAYFGATEAGNFEGANVLRAHGPRPNRLVQVRPRLLPGLAPPAGLRDPRAPAHGAGPPDVAGARRQAPHGVERAHGGRAGRRRRPARPVRLRGGRARVRRLPPHRAPRRPGPPPAHVEGGPGARPGLPRGPRLPRRRPPDPLRGDVRGALVHGGRGARPRHGRSLRRRRGRRLLHDRRRRRGAGRAPQGPRGRPHPVGQRRRLARAAAARRPHRGGRVDAPRRVGHRAHPSDRGAPPERLRAPAPGRRVLARAGARGCPRGRRREPARPHRARRTAAERRPGRRPARHRRPSAHAR